MPTYQYACKACGEQLEAVQSFSEASLTECPRCQGELRKVFSAVGVVFKGSGFYKTDSRAPSSTTDKPAAATTDSAPAAKSDNSSSSTPATAPAPAPAASSTSTSSSKAPAAS